ncbi:mitochondrial ribosomal protein S11 [Nomia melanderi]|uniref:mitochondrial ribosomal protein S11 n=1 Tax=Nomia melanderi TaxID=2448451 RepID=UPI001304572D|nr:uncharacterized protein LOC116429104 [Nomia melanderi]
MIVSTLRSVIVSLTRFRISDIDKVTGILSSNSTNIRCIHLTPIDLKEIRSENNKIRTVSKKLLDETSFTVEPGTSALIFPDEFTPNKLFDGILFKDLPIVYVKATPNNTILSLSDAMGLGKILHSAGMEGFKNAKKGTNIAGQQAAQTFGNRVLESGIKVVRLKLRGIGPGRMAAVKGLQLSGLNIVSVTDATRVSWTPPRPRKQRRV